MSLQLQEGGKRGRLSLVKGCGTQLSGGADSSGDPWARLASTFAKESRLLLARALPRPPAPAARPPHRCTSGLRGKQQRCHGRQVGQALEGSGGFCSMTLGPPDGRISPHSSHHTLLGWVPAS